MQKKIVHEKYVLFVDSFFVNTKLFKLLKFIKIAIVEIIKINFGFFESLIQIRTIVIKKNIEKK